MTARFGKERRDIFCLKKQKVCILESTFQGQTLISMINSGGKYARCLVSFRSVITASQFWDPMGQYSKTPISTEQKHWLQIMMQNYTHTHTHPIQPLLSRMKLAPGLCKPVPCSTGALSAPCLVLDFCLCHLIPLRNFKAKVLFWFPMFLDSENLSGTLPNMMLQWDSRT